MGDMADAQIENFYWSEGYCQLCGEEFSDLWCDRADLRYCEECFEFLNEEKSIS